MRKPGNDGEAAAPAVASSVAAWVWVGRAGGGVSRCRGFGGVSGGGANEGGAVAVVWGVSYTALDHGRQGPDNFLMMMVWFIK